MPSQETDSLTSLPRLTQAAGEPMGEERGEVHIFSIYETSSTKFLHLPVEPKNESPMVAQILQTEKRVQRYVNSDTAIVRYLGIGMSAVSMNAPDADDAHWEPRQG
jgi:hypothetical protein